MSKCTRTTKHNYDHQSNWTSTKKRFNLLSFYVRLFEAPLDVAEMLSVPPADPPADPPGSGSEYQESRYTAENTKGGSTPVS